MLFFEFHGLSDANVAEHAAEVSAIVEAHGGHDFTRADSPEARATLWQARHDAYHAALALRPGSRGWTTDACVPISRLADCIRETKADLATSHLIGPLIGHVGDGNFHLVIPVNPDVTRGSGGSRATDRPPGGADAGDGRHLLGRARRRPRQDEVPRGGARPGGARRDAHHQAGPRSAQPDEPGKDPAADRRSEIGDRGSGRRGCDGAPGTRDRGSGSGHENEAAAARTRARRAGAEAQELHHARRVAAPERRTPVSAEPRAAGGDAGRDVGGGQRRPQRERRLPIRASGGCARSIRGSAFWRNASTRPKSSTRPRRDRDPRRRASSSGRPSPTKTPPATNTSCASSASTKSI